jgi:hypothetical protein
MRIDNAYAGTITGGGNNFTFTDNVDLGTNGGSATFLPGAGTWELGGNWKSLGLFAVTRAGTLKMTGTTKTVEMGNRHFDNVEITGSVSNLNSSDRCQVLTVSGTFTIDYNWRSYVSSSTSGTGTISVSNGVTLTAKSVANVSGGSITGAGTINIASASITQQDGTWDIVYTTVQAACSIIGATYSGTFLFENDAAGVGYTLTMGTGASQSFTFNGPVTFDADTSQTYTVDMDTYDPDIEFRGDVTISETGGGSLVWDVGGGDITLGGLADQDSVDFDGKWVEDITVNKSTDTAKVKLTGNVATDTFTGTRGRLDLNDYDITSAGNVDINGGSGSPQFAFHNGTNNDMSNGVIDIDGGALTLDGASGTQLVIDDLDFNLASGVSGTATYCSVTGSAITRVDTNIDATGDGNIDNENNSEYWIFSAGGIVVNRTIQFAA